MTNKVSNLQRAVRCFGLAALGLTAAQANALCTFGGSGEPSLQGSFDSLLGANTLSATTSCRDEGDDAAWTTLDSIGDYILLGGGDGDYQDFVAVVQDITPVPLPPAVLLMISGLVGLAGVSRRTA